MYNKQNWIVQPVITWKCERLMPHRTDSQAGCLASLLALFAGKSRIRETYHPPTRKPRKLPYQLNTSLLSAQETDFFRALQWVVGTQAVICPKVRIADFIAVQGGENWRTDFNAIAQKHVDFLLCDSASLRPLLAIELDDRSHDRPERRKRDQLVKDVYSAAGLPLLNVRGRRDFNVPELAAQVLPYLPRLPEKAASPLPEIAAIEPRCPKCGGETGLKIARTGKYAGQKFYACLKYPECRGIVPIEEKALA